ncbi:MAG: hydroxymethylbilane synthase [Planctomycetaceae bacterium]
MATSTEPLLRLATRASRLALWQATHVTQLLQSVAPDVRVEVVEVSTIGDRDRASRLAEMGGQGVFTKEVQAVVLDGRADVAVHSLKDLPTETADGLLLAGVPDRGPRWDVLVTRPGLSLQALDDVPSGARVATGSLRRRAQLLHRRPDLVPVEVRGNVETRLRKLDDGEFDVLVLAEAGLVRLGLGDRVACRLQPPAVYPAVGQAALGLECRADDGLACKLLQRITHASTLAEVSAERALLRTLRAGCHAPVGVLATTSATGGLRLEGIVLSIDGRERLFAQTESMDLTPDDLGGTVATQLLDSGAQRLLQSKAPSD